MKKWEGGHVSDGSNTIQPWVLEQLSLISSENAPNTEFYTYPEKDAIAVRLKNWNPQLRYETERRLKIKIDPATKEDFFKYYGYWE